MGVGAIRALQTAFGALDEPLLPHRQSVLVLVRKKPPLTPVLRRAGDPRIAPVRVQRRVGVCSVSTECPLRV